VEKVIAFNRGTGLTARQVAAFETFGLDSSLVASPKLVLLGGDLSVPGFGLSEKDLKIVSLSCL
jgi:hypothetical protein